MKNSGFSLIEIIVVLIILGVLVALAMTTMFNWVERSRAAEGYATLGAIAKEFQICVLKNQDLGICDNEFNGKANSFSTKYFYYSFASTVDYQNEVIIATRNNIDIVNDPGGQVTCTDNLGNQRLWGNNNGSKLGIIISVSPINSSVSDLTISKCTPSTLYEGL